MASRAVDHPKQARDQGNDDKTKELLMSSEAVVGGGGKPKKKNPAADGRNRRALTEIGNLPTIRRTEPNTSSRLRSHRTQLKAQTTAAAEIIDVESSEDELRQAEKSSSDHGKAVHQAAHVQIIDLDSSEDEHSQAVKSSVASERLGHSAAQVDIIELESSEDEQSPKESIGDHDPKCNVSMEETALISQSNEVESTIATEANEVQNLEAQSEMTTYAEVESVTLGPLHYDNMTASTEEVQVDGYPVFDYSNHGTEGLSDYDVFGNTTGSVSDIATFEEKDQPEIGAADNIEVEVDLEYEEVDEEAEAQFDIEALEENGQPEIEAAENIVVKVHVDNDYEEVCKLETEQVQTIEGLEERGQSETGFKVSMVYVMGISLLISALISVLIGSTIFSHVKKGNSSTSNRVISIYHQSLPTKQLNASPDVPCSTAHNFQDIPFSWTWNKEPWHSALSCFRKSSLHHLTGLEASAEDETQEKRGATVAVCQPPVLTKNLNASPIVPASFHERLSSWSWITESCHSEMSSLQNSSLYQTQGLTGLYEAERQEQSGAGRILEESPWTPQWAYSYGGSTTFDPNKNVHGGDEFVAPQWARRLYGSFKAHEKYPIKNRYGDDEEVVTSQPHHVYGNFTTDEKIPIKN